MAAPSKKIIEFKVSKDMESGKISFELAGDDPNICLMMAELMARNLDAATIIAGAIPSFLDIKGIHRAAFCEQIMKAQGQQSNPSINKTIN